MNDERNQQRANELYIIMCCLMPDAADYDIFDRLQVIYEVRMRFEADREKAYPEDGRVRPK